MGLPGGQGSRVTSGLVCFALLGSIALGLLLATWDAGWPQVALTALVVVGSISAAVVIVRGVLRHGLHFSVHLVVVLNSVGWLLIYTGDDVAAAAARQSMMRYFGAMVGLSTGVLLLLTLAQSATRERVPFPSTGAYRPAYWNAAIAFFGMATLLALVSGLLWNNDLGYLVGDLYKLWILPAAVALVVRTVKIDSVREVLGWMLGLLVVVAAWQLLVFARGLEDGGAVRLKRLFWTDRLLALVLALVLLRYVSHRVSKLALLCALGVVLVEGFTSLFRMFWILVPVAIAGIVGVQLYVERDARVLARYGLYILLVVIAAGLIVGGLRLTLGPGKIIYVAGLLRNRFALLVGEDFAIAGIGLRTADEGLVHRITEMRAVFRRFAREGNLLTWIAGFGLGAEYPIGPEFSDTFGALYESRGYRAHTVHNLFVGILFRMGVVGVASFVALLVTLVQELARLLRTYVQVSGSLEPLSRQAVLIGVCTTIAYWLVTIPTLLDVSAFLGDVNWGILVGLMWVAGRVLCERHRQSVS